MLKIANFCNTAPGLALIPVQENDTLQHAAKSPGLTEKVFSHFSR